MRWHSCALMTDCTTFGTRHLYAGPMSAVFLFVTLTCIKRIIWGAQAAHACGIPVLSLKHIFHCAVGIVELEGAQRVSQSMSRPPLCIAFLVSSRTSLFLRQIISDRTLSRLSTLQYLQ